jgi:hypothetical protein
MAKENTVLNKLQLGLGALASNGTLNQTIRVGLRGENSGIFAQIFDILVP